MRVKPDMAVDETPDAASSPGAPCSHPVDPGRLHYHGVNLPLLQPCGQGVKIGGKGPKALHRRLITLTGHGHPVGIRPDINPRSIEVQLLSRRRAPPTGATLLWLATA